MSSAERFGRELLDFANRGGAPRMWRREVRKSVPVVVRLCATILIDLEKQDWQQLDEDFSLLHCTLERVYNSGPECPHKPAIDPWLYDELIIPVLRSGATSAKIKAAMTFQWHCRCCPLGEARLGEVLRCILPLAVIPAPAADIDDKVDMLVAANYLVEREISLHHGKADASPAASAQEAERLRWLLGVKSGLLQTLFACVEIVMKEEQTSDYMMPYAFFSFIRAVTLTSVFGTLVQYVAVRGDYADELALTVLKASYRHPLLLHFAECNLDSAASAHAIDEHQPTTSCCEHCIHNRTQELANMLAVLAEAHPSLAAYLRAVGLVEKAENWSARLPGAKQPLSRLLKAFAALPAADSDRDQQAQGSKGPKACALCGAARSSNNGSSGAQQGTCRAVVDKLRCCTGCRSVYYCCQACQLVDWRSSHCDICKTA